MSELKKYGLTPSKHGRYGVTVEESEKGSLYLVGDVNLYIQRLKQENADLKASRDSVKAEAVREAMVYTDSFDYGDDRSDAWIDGFNSAVSITDNYVSTLTQGKDNKETTE